MRPNLIARRLLPLALLAGTALVTTGCNEYSEGNCVDFHPKPAGTGPAGREPSKVDCNEPDSYLILKYVDEPDANRECDQFFTGIEAVYSENSLAGKGGYTLCLRPQRVPSGPHI